MPNHLLLSLANGKPHSIAGGHTETTMTTFFVINSLRKTP